MTSLKACIILLAPKRKAISYLSNQPIIEAFLKQQVKRRLPNLMENDSNPWNQGRELKGNSQSSEGHDKKCCKISELQTKLCKHSKVGSLTSLNIV
jgi:hypothetical protein